MMKHIILFAGILIPYASTSQNLKLKTISILAGQQFIHDTYSSFDYFKGYAKDPSSLNTDSMAIYPFSDLVSSNPPTYKEDWYHGKSFSLLFGFQPKKENRELTFGIQYSQISQSKYSGFKNRSLPWDTLSIQNSNGEIDTFYSTLHVNENRIFGLNTKNLFVSIDYLFKTNNTCINYFVGIGFKVGLSLENTLYSEGTPILSQSMFNPETSQYYLTHHVTNYPSSFYEPELQYSRTIYDCKQLFYFVPNILFGMKVPLSQTKPFLDHLSLDLLGSVGLEAQMMKRNTLFIRPIISGNFGLTYSL